MNWLAVAFVVAFFMAWTLCKAAKRGDAQLERDRERMAYEASQKGEHPA